MKKMVLILVAFSSSFLIFNSNKQTKYRKMSLLEMGDFLVNNCVVEDYPVAFLPDEGFLPLSRIYGEYLYISKGNILEVIDLKTKNVIAQKNYDMPIIDYEMNFVIGYDDGLLKVIGEKEYHFSGAYLDSYYKDGTLYLATKDQFYNGDICLPVFYDGKTNEVQNIYSLMDKYNYGITIYIINDKIAHCSFLGLNGKVVLDELSYIKYDKTYFWLNLEENEVKVAGKDKI